MAAPFSSSGTVATVDAEPAAAAATQAAAVAFLPPPLLFWARSVFSAAAEEEAGMTCKRAAAEGPAYLYNVVTQSKAYKIANTQGNC